VTPSPIVVAPPPGMPPLPPKPVGPSPVVVAAEPPVAGDLGGPNPGWVIASAPDGAWTVTCEARVDTDKDKQLELSFGHHGELVGDEPAPYLIRGAGLGEELAGDLAGVDPQRRFLVVAVKSTLELFDVAANIRTKLPGADVRYVEGGVFGGARVAFAGDRLLYVRMPETKKGRRVVVVRSLANGAEHVIDPGEGELRDAAVLGGYLALRVFQAVPGTLRQGVVGRSGPAHTVGGRRCRADSRVTDPDADDRFAPLDKPGIAVARSGALVVGDGLVIAGADGALAIERSGTATQIAPASCGAVVVARSHSQNSVLYACGKQHALWRAGTSTPIAELVESDKLDEDSEYAQLGDRLAYVGDHLVDLGTGRTRVRGMFSVLLVHGTKALLHEREGALAIYDLTTGAWTELPTPPADLDETARRGRLVAVGPHGGAAGAGVVVDLEAGVELGAFTGTAHAISSTGWVLQRSASGAFAWTRPAPTAAR